MEKVLLTCFAPFKSLPSDEYALGLFSSLVLDLQRLQKSLEGKAPSLHWCSEAMIVIKKIHSYFLLYLERTKGHDSWESVNVLDEYMRTTLEILDFCNLLKSAIAGLDRYRMVVDFTVKRMEEAAFSTVTSRIELERLERENSNKHFDVKTWRSEMKLNKAAGLCNVKLKTRTDMHVLQAINSTMSIVSILIFSSIIHPVPIKIDEALCTRMPIVNSFSDSVQKLVASFTERFLSVQDNARPILYENEMIEDAFSDLKAQVSAGELGVHKGILPETVDVLKKRSLALKEGLDLFECVLNESFEEVIKGRKQVISLITANNGNW